ncbi:hypothetical protein Tco_0598459 [Tanacetum coccineum]
MANLEFCDKNNMVAYLKKPTGSEGFQEIVDFLNGSHIRYALTINPTIYVSLIEKFWQTAAVKTVDNGEQEITATIDGKEFTVTEASVRRHLQLADVDSISVLPNTKNFKQLSLMGYVLTDDKLTFQKDEVVYEEWDDSVERAITTDASLDAAQDNGNILRTQSTAIPNVPLPQGIGAGGSPKCQEATRGSIAQNRSEKVESLETGLKQTKQTYSATCTKLIKKEDSSKQGRMIEDIDQDAGITLVTSTKVSSQEDQLGIISAAKVLADAAKKNVIYTRRRIAVSTGSGGVSTTSRLFSTAKESVSTAGMVQEVSIPSPVATKDKGKAIMQESEQPKKIKKRVQIQISRDEEVAQKLQEEVAADEDFIQQLQAGEKCSKEDLPMKLVELVNQRKKFFAQQRAEAKRNKPITPAQQKAYMSNYIKNQEGGYSINQLKSLSFEQVKEIFETTMRRVQSFVLIGSELEVQRLKRASQEVLEEPVKRQKNGEGSEPTEEPKPDELSQEEKSNHKRIYNK